MKDYISREAALNIIEHNDKVYHYADEQYESVVYATTQYICDAIAKMPTVDVQPLSVVAEHIKNRLCETALNETEFIASAAIADMAERIDFWISELKGADYT